MVIALFVFMGLSCAKQGQPPGGPVDKIPPTLSESKPVSLATNVDLNEPIVFVFSEPMNEKSVEENLFLIPIPSNWPEFSWKSKSTVLTLDNSQPLRDNTTYVISIGTKAKDLKNNPLQDSIMLSFSTGEIIENGKINGTLVPYDYFAESRAGIAGIDVVAYRIIGSDSDPDPRFNVPDYVTQSGDDGTYEIIGLSSDRYRLFAIGDKDGNGFYSEGYDTIGIAPHDVEFADGDSLVIAPHITVSSKDSTSVQLNAIRAYNGNRVEVLFDRDILSSPVELSFTGIDIKDWFVLNNSRRTLRASTSVQEDGKQYNLERLSVIDQDGNGFLPPMNAPYFIGIDKPDTTALEIVEWYPRILTPGTDSITLIFNRIIDIPETSDAVYSDDELTKLTLIRTGPNTAEIVPLDKWRDNTNYTITLDSLLVKGIAGNMLTTENSKLGLRVVAPDTLGFIEGDMIDYAASGETEYRLIFHNIDTDTKHEISTDGSESWSTGPMLPGRYVCFGYRDDDNDGVHFRGTISPFKHAEPAAAIPDTILVTSRWTNGDNTFIFR